MKANVSIDVRQANAKTSILDIQGEINAYAENVLMDAYTQASSSGAQAIILNFSKLDYMNSSGIGLLVTLLIRVQRQKQKFQRVEGSMTIGAETYPIVDCSLRGNRILFAVERPAQGNKEVSSYEGQISGNTIAGKISYQGTRRAVNGWQATRDPSTMVSIAE